MISPEERKIVLRTLEILASQRISLIDAISDYTKRSIKLRTMEQEIEEAYRSLATLIKDDIPSIPPVR